jgi:predicted YcjX-like family ATPase
MNDDSNEPSRVEHLAWCKKRALEYLEPGRFYSVENAGASLVSDLNKHSQTRGHPAIKRCFTLLATGADADQMRSFIENVE